MVRRSGGMANQGGPPVQELRPGLGSQALPEHLLRVQNPACAGLGTPVGRKQILRPLT